MPDTITTLFEIYRLELEGLRLEVDQGSWCTSTGSYSCFPTVTILEHPEGNIEHGL